LEESNDEQKERSLASIKREIRVKKIYLNRIHAARLAVRNTALPVAQRGAEAAPLAAVLAATPTKRISSRVQGDSWFDYPPGTDLIDCLHRNHGHEIVNIAVAGSILNDGDYGLVCRVNCLGCQSMQTQSDDPSRIAELVQRILENKPQALLLSAGGNDIAGDEFFSLIITLSWA